MRVEGAPLKGSGRIILSDGTSLRASYLITSHAYRSEVESGHNYEHSTIQSGWEYSCEITSMEAPERLPSIGEFGLQLEDGQVFTVEGMHSGQAGRIRLRVLNDGSKRR